MASPPPSFNPLPAPRVWFRPRQVLDEQIDQEKLVLQFRKGLTDHLEEVGLGKSGLAAVFEEMDTTGRGELTIKELSNVLFKLNYHASKVRTTKQKRL